MAEQRKRLGDLLVEAGLLSDEQLQEALQIKESDQKLGDVLLQRGDITEKQLIEVLEYQLGIPHISLNQYPVEEEALALVPKETARQKQLIPLRRNGNVLHVAMADPLDYFALDDIRLSTGMRIESAIAAKDDISRAINRHYRVLETRQEAPSDSDIEALAEGDVEDAPAVRIVNELIEEGLEQEASDIHIDPQETRILVRYRVDGILKTERTYPKSVQNVLTARVKIMANLNITESRLPQDGRVKVNLRNAPVDMRIATLPTVFGEKIVIRILDLSSALNKISELGFNKMNYRTFMKMIEQPSGMVLITGPTGSGKSSTLYAALNHLNTDEVNIMTVEDPVEYQLDGINQVQVNTNVGLTFATGLRSMLRQDPNIVMVGEIRDAETAEIAIRASLTGHLVFSTLHTNSAIATIPRLIDMGVEPYMVVSSLSGVVAQRLVRRICPSCRQGAPPSSMAAEMFKRRGISAPDVVYSGTGCDRCSGTGYKGRMAIHEVLQVDDDIRSMMMNNQSTGDIRQYATENGMLYLVDDGLLKVRQGLTTLEEVMRVALDE
ncbi:type IV pilus assembly protein PilB [Salsuginibacillus halophilus]|uniref:Type IV pilus assembly protein PilB n=1 Tax=Salsuginibacillus halophilus TaxID=517424 RepID=A0A2P8HCU8_9BACI|nr:ATPase, T2SS/T4P/T4SS family [Salsuginibacillus halophilus]PSL43982.1 type IV pilus assembly protein PilB [Salsuginibacillus halophilus]